LLTLHKGRLLEEIRTHISKTCDTSLMNTLIRSGNPGCPTLPVLLVITSMRLYFCPLQCACTFVHTLIYMALSTTHGNPHPAQSSQDIYEDGPNERKRSPHSGLTTPAYPPTVTGVLRRGRAACISCSIGNTCALGKRTGFATVLCIRPEDTKQSR
jgi:hypothetical protein